MPVKQIMAAKAKLDKKKLENPKFTQAEYDRNCLSSKAVKSMDRKFLR